jgi:hypothetical protein
MHRQRGICNILFTSELCEGKLLRRIEYSHFLAAVIWFCKPHAREVSFLYTTVRPQDIAIRRTPRQLLDIPADLLKLIELLKV